ncbi:restriction endonuclease [Sutcliffiella halmapala]|uniref:restriction endonuclease n=1 Tax=Sutcliffiella halmapala TaxID=79882 RepID=UPI000994F610|nr:restriction endonuclease [Sutcliffiella halmapala]
MEYFIIVILLGLLIFLLKNRRSLREEEYYRQIIVKDEFKRTIALGLYQRFCKEVEEKKYSSTFLKNNPLEFEHFIADVFKHKYGLEAFVTKSSGDFGVDIEHGIGEDKVLGQVKCYREDMGYETIAILHSNMVKQNVSKGYVVSTAGFNENARSYAEGLDIDLINGMDLVEMWINHKSPIVKTIEYQPFINDKSDTINM